MSQTQTATDLYTQAKVLIKSQKYDEAKSYLEQSLQKAKNAEAYHDLGVIHGMRNELEKARECFEEAVELNPEAHKSLAALAGILVFEGDIRMGMGHYMLAIQANPQELSYKQKFLEVAGTIPFVQFNQAVKDIVLECLKTPDLECSRANILWHSLLATDPVFSSVYTITLQGHGLYFNKKAFARISDFKPLLDPYFLLGLKKLGIYHLAFEEFLTGLRDVLLHDLGAKPPKFTPEEHTAVSSALSCYCFYTEYIFDCSRDEKNTIAALRMLLETDAQTMKDPASIAMYACYAPLSTLKNARKIMEDFSRVEPLSDMIRLQIQEPLALQEISKEIACITEIDDQTSLKVREQYEEFPYPKWKEFSREIYDESVEGHLRGTKAQILVAGCGTGKEAIELGIVFPDAQVLAVDLCRNSLAYGLSKAKEYNVGNVIFRQADILRLGSLPEKFDYIVSSGVLHHLQQPLEGWKILVNMLNASGLMRIALYSKHGRRFLPEIHRIIKDGKYDSTREGMSLFRKKSAEILQPHQLNFILSATDYYHMSMYRDFLFHVQEQPFDIPEIQEALRSLNLTFLKFQLLKSQVQNGVRAQYHLEYPDDPGESNAEHWHSFEMKYPDTFMAMYRFWCKKPG